MQLAVELEFEDEYEIIILYTLRIRTRLRSCQRRLPVVVVVSRARNEH